MTWPYIYSSTFARTIFSASLCSAFSVYAAVSLAVSTAMFVLDSTVLLAATVLRDVAY
jgi:hypothetical protein